MPPISRMFLDQVTVKAAENGLLAVTVELPADLVRDYCRFLESLAEFFHRVDRQRMVVAAERRAAALALDPELDRSIADYRQRLVAAYDAYTATGLNRQQAIKNIAADLRRDSHPWCTVDVVRCAMIEAGRGGRPGRPRAAHSDKTRPQACSRDSRQ